MGTNVLPQALCMIPRNRGYCEPKRLSFSASLCRQPLQVNSARLAVSRVSSPDLVRSFGKLDRRSFVVRAEADAEGESVGEETQEADQPATPAAEAELEAEAVVESEAETEEKPPRRPRIKLGDIMGILNKKAIVASDEERPTPDIRTGDIIEIKKKVPDRKRLVVYKGIVISKQNAGIHTTIRVRRIMAGIGVEIIFPVYSPTIKEIKVVRHRKVRRARLYYLRDKLPRFSTFK